MLCVSRRRPLHAGRLLGKVLLDPLLQNQRFDFRISLVIFVLRCGSLRYSRGRERQEAAAAGTGACSRIDGGLPKTSTLSPA